MTNLKSLIAAKTKVAMAAQESNPSERLAMLKDAQKVLNDVEIEREISEQENSLKNGSAFVGIERVVKIGKVKGNYEGSIFIEESDGRLRPVNGQELNYIAENYPTFLKNWRLDD